ncbi:MAG: hypothetical protein ABJO09_00160 [Hyphomicrobiales bacterium]
MFESQIHGILFPMTRRQLNILIPVVGVAIIIGIIMGWLNDNSGQVVYVLTPADTDDAARIEELVTTPLENDLKASDIVASLKTLSVAGLSAIRAEPSDTGTSIERFTDEVLQLVPDRSAAEMTLRPSVIGLGPEDIVHVFRVYNDFSDGKLMNDAADILIGQLKTEELRIFKSPQSADSENEEQIYVALGEISKDTFDEMVERVQNSIPPEIYLNAHFQISERF